jgi:hypothetical protein
VGSVSGVGEEKGRCTCNDDLEAVAPLAVVCGGFCLDLDTPSDALDVRYGGRVRAVYSIGILRRITLVVDIECLTPT